MSQPILVVLRGPSATGKSTVASGLRTAYRERSLAIVRQDVIRRDMLRERDEPGAHNIDLLRTITLVCLERGFHTILEGILDAGRYGDMLADLAAIHRGPQFWFYLDATFETTLKRHATKPVADEISEEQMRDWYRERDLLPNQIETVIPESSTAEQTVARVLAVTGLLDSIPNPEVTT